MLETEATGTVPPALWKGGKLNREIVFWTFLWWLYQMIPKHVVLFLLRNVYEVYHCYISIFISVPICLCNHLYIYFQIMLSTPANYSLIEGLLVMLHRLIIISKTKFKYEIYSIDGFCCANFIFHFPVYCVSRRIFRFCKRRSDDKLFLYLDVELYRSSCNRKLGWVVCCSLLTFVSHLSSGYLFIFQELRYF